MLVLNLQKNMESGRKGTDLNLQKLDTVRKVYRPEAAYRLGEDMHKEKQPPSDKADSKVKDLNLWSHKKVGRKGIALILRSDPVGRKGAALNLQGTLPITKAGRKVTGLNLQEDGRIEKKRTNCRPNTCREGMVSLEPTGHIHAGIRRDKHGN